MVEIRDFIIDHTCEGCGDYEKACWLREDTQLRLCRSCDEALHELLQEVITQTVNDFIGSKKVDMKKK